MAQPRISFGFTSADLNLDATSSSGRFGQAQLQSMKKSRVSKVRARKRLPIAHGYSASNTSSGSDYADCAPKTQPGIRVVACVPPDLGGLNPTDGSLRR